MNIAFFLGEMNLRGVANSTYTFALYNESILKNKSTIFFDKKNSRNIPKVLKKFKKKFKVIGVQNLENINLYKEKLNIEYLYISKGGKKDKWHLSNIKTLVHAVYPQKLHEVHGHKYAYISEWISKNFSRKKIDYVPLVIELNKNKTNLRKKLKIKKNQLVLGCHGGESSFDLKFVQDTLIDIVNKRNDITFLFININKFYSHKKIIFLKGSSDEIYKKKFLNSCDAMIYGRSLGESFGIACGEFSSLNKLIISYKFNRHRAHLDHLYNQNYIEYSSRNNLFNIIKNLDKKKLLKKRKNKYSNYNAKYIMKIFQSVFLTPSYKINFSLFDYFMNYLANLKMSYYYVRHKIYAHYYRFFG